VLALLRRFCYTLLENLQLQKELLRYKKATYGPRADRLNENELAQALLEFAEELEQKPLPAEGLPQEKPSRKCDAYSGAKDGGP
jgi:hypothetical protein